MRRLWDEQDSRAPASKRFTWISFFLFELKSTQDSTHVKNEVNRRHAPIHILWCFVLAKFLTHFGISPCHCMYWRWLAFYVVSTLTDESPCATHGIFMSFSHERYAYGCLHHRVWAREYAPKTAERQFMLWLTQLTLGNKQYRTISTKLVAGGLLAAIQAQNTRHVFAWHIRHSQTASSSSYSPTKCGCVWIRCTDYGRNMPRIGNFYCLCRYTHESICRRRAPLKKHSSSTSLLLLRWW